LQVLENNRGNIGSLGRLRREVYPNTDVAMDDAEAAGRAIEVGSNFFLFFSSEMRSSAMASHDMHAMPAVTARPSPLTATGVAPETQARRHK
jgi:hypothetical protein